MRLGTVYDADLYVNALTSNEESNKTWARGYKKIFMFKIFLLINVKMPYVGILTFMSRKNNILGLSELDKSCIS